MTIAYLRVLTTSLAVSAGFFATQVHAGNVNGRSEAVIVRPLTFITVDNLEFGNMFVANTAGTVVIPPTGARTRTGGVTLQGTAFQPARFAGQGAFGQQVQVSMGANSYSLTRVGGGAPALTLDTFIIGSTPTAQLTTNPRVFTIGNATGIFNFPLGATLRVGANQPAGTYSTTFRVTLVYQ
jgi:Domain of unknown function (DUF4402)